MEAEVEAKRCLKMISDGVLANHISAQVCYPSSNRHIPKAHCDACFLSTTMGSQFTILILITVFCHFLRNTFRSDFRAVHNIIYLNGFTTKNMTNCPFNTSKNFALVLVLVQVESFF